MRSIIPRCEHAIEGESAVRVSNRIEKPAKIRREMAVRLDETSPRVTVEHRIVHEGGDPLEVAPWGLSVMAPGGYAVLPHPPLGTHPEAFLPNRVMVVWPFTDLADKRFWVGQRLMRLQQADGVPFKIGLRHPEGWAAYVLGDHLFIKSIPLIEDAVYPDMGSNFETFTNSGFLELETLGPLKKISAGETIVHTRIMGGLFRRSAAGHQGRRGVLESLGALPQATHLRIAISSRGRSGRRTLRYFCHRGKEHRTCRTAAFWSATMSPRSREGRTAMGTSPRQLTNRLFASAASNLAVLKRCQARAPFGERSTLFLVECP